jgi:hypothetical protein
MRFGHRPDFGAGQAVSAASPSSANLIEGEAESAAALDEGEIV